MFASRDCADHVPNSPGVEGVNDTVKKQSAGRLRHEPPVVSISGTALSGSRSVHS